MSLSPNDRYLKEYRCGPCSRVEILLDQKLGMPADGEHCPQCKTRMLLLRIQPMSCVTERIWEHAGTEIKEQKLSLPSVWEQAKAMIMGIVPVEQTPVPSEFRCIKCNWHGHRDVSLGLGRSFCPSCNSNMRLDSEKFDYKSVPCSECGIELSPESFTRNTGLGNDGTLGKPRYCDVCDSIVKSMATSPGLIEAHEKWESDQYRKKGLIDGR